MLDVMAEPDPTDGRFAPIEPSAPFQPGAGSAPPPLPPMRPGQTPGVGWDAPPPAAPPRPRSNRRRALVAIPIGLLTAFTPSLVLRGCRSLADQVTSPEVTGLGSPGDVFDIGMSSAATAVAGTVNWDALRAARRARVDADRRFEVRAESGAPIEPLPSGSLVRRALWSPDGRWLVLRMSVSEAPGGREDRSDGQVALAVVLGEAYYAFNLERESVTIWGTFGGLPKAESLTNTELQLVRSDGVDRIPLGTPSGIELHLEDHTSVGEFQAPGRSEMDPLTQATFAVGDDQLIYAGLPGLEVKPGAVWRVRRDGAPEKLGEWSADWVHHLVPSADALHVYGVARDNYVCAVRSDTPFVLDVARPTYTPIPLPDRIGLLGEVYVGVGLLPDGTVVAASRAAKPRESADDCPEPVDEWMTTFRLDSSAVTWIEDPTPSPEAIDAVDWAARPTTVGNG